MALTARSCAPPLPLPPRVQGVPQGPGRGIIPRAIEDVFAAIQAGDVGAERARFLVRASYLQIYNEVRGQSAGVHRSGADGALRALRCNTPPTPLRCAQTAARRAGRGPVRVGGALASRGVPSDAGGRSQHMGGGKAGEHAPCMQAQHDTI